MTVNEHRSVHLDNQTVIKLLNGPIYNSVSHLVGIRSYGMHILGCLTCAVVVVQIE